MAVKPALCNSAIVNSLYYRLKVCGCDGPIFPTTTKSQKQQQQQQPKTKNQKPGPKYNINLELLLTIIDLFIGGHLLVV